MRIAVCVNTLSAGGAEAFAAHLAIGYKKNGHSVILLVHDIRGNRGEYLYKELKDNWVQVININKNGVINKISFPFIYAKIFKEHKIEIVHSNLEQTDTYVALSKLFYRKPVLIRTLHNKLPFSKYPHWAHSLLFRSFACNVACGEQMKNDYQFKDLSSQLIAIENGVPIIEKEETLINEWRNSIRKGLGIDDKAKVLLHIGTMSPRFGGVLTKGHDIVLECLKEHKELDFIYLVVGDNSEMNNSGLYPQEIISDSRIRFTGIVSSPYPYIAAADGVLVPSRTEGLPISTLECAFLGKPILCSNIKPLEPFKCDSTRYFELDKEGDFATQLGIFLNDLDELEQNATKNSIEFMKRYSIEGTVKEYLDLIQKMRALDKKKNK